ncbi:hypothetical protein QQ045_021597 [Rhodiola kirilowii]
MEFPYGGGRNENPPGMKFATLRSPKRPLPLNCSGENRPPTEGNCALQVESGVTTCRLQLLSSVDTNTCRGFISMENSPEGSVNEADITFVPHRIWTSASGKHSSSGVSARQLGNRPYSPDL